MQDLNSSFYAYALKTHVNIRDWISTDIRKPLNNINFYVITEKGTRAFSNDPR